jgi:rare lipoprotein A
MKSNIAVFCAIAGTFLIISMDVASAAERHTHRAHRHTRMAVQSTCRHGATDERRDARRPFADATLPARDPLQSGVASVYSGGRTANGEVAAAGGLTAAHRTLPFGTMVKVTNGSTGRSVVVRINDRGPFVRGRVIDITPAAARALGFSGLAHVTLSVVGRG